MLLQEQFVQISCGSLFLVDAIFPHQTSLTTCLYSMNWRRNLSNCRHFLTKCTTTRSGNRSSSEEVEKEASYVENVDNAKLGPSNVWKPKISAYRRRYSNPNASRQRVLLTHKNEITPKWRKHFKISQTDFKYYYEDSEKVLYDFLKYLKKTLNRTDKQLGEVNAKIFFRYGQLLIPSKASFPKNVSVIPT